MAEITKRERALVDWIDTNFRLIDTALWNEESRVRKGNFPDARDYKRWCEEVSVPQKARHDLLRIWVGDEED